MILIRLSTNPIVKSAFIIYLQTIKVSNNNNDKKGVKVVVQKDKVDIIK